MIVLTFDDNTISEWAAISPWMRERGMKATFYVAYMDKYSPAEFRHLRSLEEAGHEIGYHGLSHSRAGVAGRPVDRKNPRLEGELEYRSFQDYLDREIHAGMRILEAEGIRPRHFAYPYGNRTPETDTELLEIFDSLRRGGLGSYDPREPIPPVWAARDFDCQRNDGILEAAPYRTIGLLMHSPTPGRMKRLGEFKEKTGVEFLTVSEAREIKGKA